MSSLAPVHREVLMAADPTTAFEVFTAHIGRWWPLDEHGIYGADATVEFSDGEIVETSPGGDRALWGTVTRWNPPETVAFTWHPGGTPEKATQVEVTFTAAAEAQTLVVLEHSGWEVFADAAGARSEYEKGWALTLELFRESVDGRGEDDTWVALLHSPGPAAPSGATIFAAPRIGEHFAFLSRMQGAGYLVAAGPLTDAPGAGMTVLRLPGADRLGEATRLATEDDTSVASGFLQVSVRPWQVMLQS